MPTVPLKVWPVWIKIAVTVNELEELERRLRLSMLKAQMALREMERTALGIKPTPLAAYCTWLQRDPLMSVRKVIGFTRVEMEGFCVRLDRETFRSPALEATLEEFYP